MRVLQQATRWTFALLLTVSSVAMASGSAQEMIQATTDKMMSALQTEQNNLEQNPAKVYQLVDEIVLPNFDFERMSKLVLGKNWSKASESQQNEFVSVFRNLLVRTYATAIAKAVLKEGGVKINYLPVSAEADAKWVTVKTQVQYQTESFAIDYNVYPDPNTNEWKVFNVVVEGISLVTNYRTEFNNDISSIGMEKLIEKIKSRNDSEMNKAISTAADK